MPGDPIDKDPRAEYSTRVQKHRTAVEKLSKRDSLFANLRLAVFTLGLILLALSIWSNLTWLWAPIVVLAFISLVVAHERVVRRKSRAQAAVRYYDRGLARLDGNWAGTGVGGNEFAPGDHPFANDLDLFGEASLFELLCTARTKAGESALAAWLLGPASVDEVKARQDAVEELRHKLDLREDLALLGGDVRSVVMPEHLVRWAEAAPVLTSKPVRIAATLLTSLAVIAALGWAAWEWGPGPLVLLALVDLFFLKWTKHDVQRVVETISEPAKDLQVLGVVLQRLEHERFNSAKLAALRAALENDEGLASARIQRLDTLVRWLENERNMFFAPIAFVLLWRVHFAYALEGWRRSNGAHVARWLNAVGELEALCALAAYAYEHPADPFPEIVDSETVYDGKALGHPLIPEPLCVRNDVTLYAARTAPAAEPAHHAAPRPAPQVLIVSGSNMSGKSTLLRTVGVNAVLALAGAPVRAERLRLCPLALGATLRIQDSIQAGKSRFYAEITRLRQLAELTNRPLPLLFLLDEILAGTNSHDRGIGAEAIIKGLLERAAIGLVTTHDLALTKVAQSLNGRALNVHFEDHLEADQLVFDYHMRPGVVQKSNALALMRAIGLQV